MLLLSGLVSVCEADAETEEDQERRGCSKSQNSLFFIWVSTEKIPVYEHLTAFGFLYGPPLLVY